MVLPRLPHSSLSGGGDWFRRMGAPASLAAIHRIALAARARDGCGGGRPGRRHGVPLAQCAFRISVRRVLRGADGIQRFVPPGWFAILPKLFPRNRVGGAAISSALLAVGGVGVRCPTAGRRLDNGRHADRCDRTLYRSGRDHVLRYGVRPRRPSTRLNSGSPCNGSRSGSTFAHSTNTLCSSTA